MKEFLFEALQAVILAAVPVLTTVLIKYFMTKVGEVKSKIENEKAAAYLGEIALAVSNAVAATNQTYVDALKDRNMFTEDAQRTALKLALDAAKNSLSAAAMRYLEQTYADVQLYLTGMIEAQVRAQK